MEAPKVDGEKGEHHEESISLDYLFQSKVDEFFEQVWQKSCALFRLPPHEVVPDNSAADLPFDAVVAASNPLRYLVSSGFAVTQHLLEYHHHHPPQSQSQQQEQLYHNHPAERPLIFRDQSIVSYDDVIGPKYNNELWAALLDGCSIVVNHADSTICPWLAVLCDDLQKSVPHAYVNVYITPPYQRAVDAHADDRDVLIIQLYGTKRWTVYRNVPIPLPYSDEQVGKDGLIVPDVVLHGPILIETTLQPGDVLYLPRGYVHHATSLDQVSCHATVAMATHDWTMAGVLERAGRHVWRNNLSLRAALPREVGVRPLTLEQKETLSHQIAVALELLRDELTVEAVENDLRQKFHRHNSRARLRRDAVLSRHAQHTSTVHLHIPAAVMSMAPTGPTAARLVSLDSYLRASTAEEKASVVQPKPGVVGQQQVGLHVHDDIYDETIRLVGRLKENGGAFLQRLRDMDSALCPMTRLALAKRCVSLGALAVVVDNVDDKMVATTTTTTSE
jgi:hypothetical protein